MSNLVDPVSVGAMAPNRDRWLEQQAKGRLPAARGDAASGKAVTRI